MDGGTHEAGRRAHRAHRLVLIIIGGVLTFVGAAAAFVGPLETYCFTLFSEGGRFHYTGFQFGSFMFGNIACQIVGYYVTALICIPLGYGHLRLRRWVQPMTLALLWAWTVLGIPPGAAFLFALLSAKDLTIAASLAAIAAVALAYPAPPVFLIRFYRSRAVRAILEAKGAENHWVEQLPVPILVMCILFGFYVVVLHALLLFNGLFPVYGTWVTGLPGIAMLDVASLCLVGLIWGTVRRRKWAWWGALIGFTALSASWISTLAASSWLDILISLNLPSFERDILRRIPLQGAHLALFAAVPLSLTLVAIMRARNCFEGVS